MPRERVRAKALKWEGGGHVLGMVRTPRQLEHSERKGKR